MKGITLRLVKRTDPRYQAIRDGHYVTNKGTHGQQLHYLVMLHDRVIGIISGASAVYGCYPRDKFFDLSKDRLIKQAQLNGIISNVVFRLEIKQPNLASHVLALWRKRIAEDWEFLYGVRVGGFETFIIRESRQYMSDRIGTLYKADNWTYVGDTKGNTKVHNKGGMNASHHRAEVVQKMIYCYRVRRGKKPVPLPDTYESSWKNKELAKERSDRRKLLFEKEACFDT